MKLRINVTEGDINKGYAQDAYSCPVARAIKRRVGKRTRVEVRNFDVAVTAYGEEPYCTAHVNMDLPQSARQFVRLFDRHQPVKPFTFTLDFPEGVLS